jgi:tetratricopeptide (TPR) repeat protein
MLATFYSMLPVFCSYLKLLVWPSGLNAQYDPPVYASLNTAVAAAGLFLLLIGWCCFRLFRSDRKAGFWALLFWIGFLPVSQIVPLVTMMNDRYVYFPMIGSAVLAGFGVTLLQDRLPPRLVPASYLFVSAILVAVAVTSFQRAGVWKNSVTLWSDSVAREPGRAMSWVSLAQALERTGEGNVPAAIEAYNRAAALDPANAYVQYGLARIYGFTGQYEKALQHVTALLRQWPDHVMGLTLLGTIRQKQGDLDGAEQILLRAAALQPDAVEVAMLLAEVSMLKADLKMARSRYLDIENRLGKFPVTAYMLGWIALREGGIDSALEWLEKAFARGYADYRSADDLQEMTALYGNPRFEKLLRRYGGRK